MKKFLFALVTLTSVSYAVAPDLGAGAVEDTNMVELGQRGMINIKTTITSVPYEDVKYVVFASTGDGNSITGASDFVQLPEFGVQIQTSGEVSTDIAGFVSEPAVKVYVKRVSNGSVVALEGTDLPEIRIYRGYKDSYTSLTSASNNFVSATGVNFSPLFFLDSATLDRLGTAVGSRPSQDTSTIQDSEGNFFTIRGLSITVPEKGVVQFATGNTIHSNAIENATSSTNSNDIQAWNTFFQNPVAFSPTTCIKVVMR